MTNTFKVHLILIIYTEAYLKTLFFVMLSFASITLWSGEEKAPKCTLQVCQSFLDRTFSFCFDEVVASIEQQYGVHAGEKCYKEAISALSIFHKDDTKYIQWTEQNTGMSGQVNDWSDVSSFKTGDLRHPSPRQERMDDAYLELVKNPGQLP